jgi:hypothetical protein
MRYFFNSSGGFKWGQAIYFDLLNYYDVNQNFRTIRVIVKYRTAAKIYPEQNDIPAPRPHFGPPAWAASSAVPILRFAPFLKKFCLLQITSIGRDIFARLSEFEVFHDGKILTAVITSP